MVGGSILAVEASGGKWAKSKRILCQSDFSTHLTVKMFRASLSQEGNGGSMGS